MLSDIPLIPRKLLLGNPSRLDPKLSPDGKSLAWLTPVDGVMNIWAAPTDAIGEAWPITNTIGRPIVWHNWTADGRWLLFKKDINGDENYSIHIVDPITSELRNLTPFPKVAAQVKVVSRDLPGRIIVGLNDRDPHWHDVWEIELETGKRTLIYENSRGLGGFIATGRAGQGSEGGQIPTRAATRFSALLMGASSPGGLFLSKIRCDLIGGFNRRNAFCDGPPIGRDMAALLRVDADTGEEHMLAEHPDADITHYLMDPGSGEVTAAAADPGRLSWMTLDSATGAVFGRLRARVPDGDFVISSQSDDNNRRIAALWTPQTAITYYLVDHGADAITELFSARPDLKSYRYRRCGRCTSGRATV